MARQSHSHSGPVRRPNYARDNGDSAVLMALCGCAKINSDKAGTLNFSGVPAFCVTNVLIVQCSTVILR